MRNGSFLSYKRRRTRKKKGSRVERTKCCRSDSGRFSLCFLLHSFLCRVSRRLALFRGTPECVRQHLRPAPFLCVEANRHRHLFAALFAVRRSPFACIYSVPIADCSVLITRPFAYILIHTFSFVASNCVGVCLRSLCRRAVPLCNLWSCVIFGPV